jgi:hypothetical protein
MKSKVISVFALLAISGSLLTAQTVTDIDTRGKTQTKPDVRIAGGFLKGLPRQDQRTAPAPIDVVFTVEDAAKIQYGKKFNYTLTVTNTGDRNILLPRTVTWSDVEDRQSKEQTYYTSRILFHLRAPASFTLMGAGLSFYGSTVQPDTLVDLKPGNSVRILGSTMMVPKGWTSPLPKGKVTIAIRAQYEVGSVLLHMGQDGYRNDETQIINEESKNTVELEYQTPSIWTPEPAP